ncbi:hypothetical protein BpHYR1_016923 [Brachionus plicatilis]|uniref:Sacsin/Nov domain-containing protein n=1 Tax=Brachionus plicatilis TaxID=10195 RepID=A0A3M7SSD0_BRAPC|nr:hypothetical protein BpHYR1_016923 [Brachionus plicatilis]
MGARYANFTMSDFSFEIPPLTAHLKPILDSYPLGGQILKELLQNAEDSGANVVKFFIDFTEYPSETLLHPELNKFQGPALLVYNNSQFDENDFESIISIRQSQKNDKPLKIGKFGLGFKSVYHLTDLPSLVSGNDLIIFDPHEKYLRQHHAKNAMRFHYDLGKENAYFENYSHQFEPYKNIELNPGQKIDFKNEFKGSLFRFPIRNKEAAQVSKLCSTYKEVDQIIYEDILESFFQDLNLILLFLRRIESIEIIEIKNGQQVLIASTTLDFGSSSQNLRQIRESFYDQLVASLSPEKTMDEETFNRDDLAYNFKIAIKTMILDRKTNEYTTTKDEYLMSSYVKFKSCSEALKNLAHKTSNFAACAAAYKLEKNFQDKFKQSRYFCFLPMPETIEKSGLPLHIHGSFGLRDDRRDFKWLSSDAKEDQAAKWNELMVSEVLNKVLIQLIDYAKDLIRNNNSDFDLNNFYYLLPDLSNIGLNWKDKHLKVFLNSLGENNLVLNRCWQWSNINQIYLTNKMDCKIEEFGQKNGLLSNNCFKDTIYNCFDPEKLSAISIPDHVLAIFESYNKLDSLNFINEELILNQMRKMFNYGGISGEQKADLLNYMIQSVSEIKMLDKIELLPLKNGKWSRFNEYSVYYFENSDLTEMFKGIDHLILDDKKLNKLSKFHLFNNLLKKNDERIISFDRDQFGRLFEKSSNSEYSFEDVERVWRFVLAEFYDSLAPLEHLSLVPHEHQGKINFLKLKDNKSYIKYFVIDEQNGRLNKLKNFFEQHSNEKNGCLFFERLPQAMRNHPKIFNYFSNFNKESLIDCLLALGRYCSKSEICIKNLIKNDMSSEQKEIVADCLNSVENVSRENFISLAHKLPIFKAINKNNEFFTIEDGKSSFLKAKLDIQNLPIDPNLIIIDVSYAEKLLSKLGLKKYKINDLIEISIDYHLTRKNCKAITAFLEWVMVNRFKKFDDVSIESFFQSSIALKPLFTNNSNEPKFLRDIYDPKDKFVKNFVPEELQLNKDYLNDLFYPSFQPHLRRNIQFKVFEKYFQHLDSNKTGLSQKNFFDKCKMIFDYMDTLENEKINRIIDLAATYQWLPCDNFSNWSEAKFYKSTQLWDSKFKNLIKHVEPIYLSELIPNKFKTKLNIISKTPNLEVVIRNLDFIVTNHESIDLNDLEAIYNYFQNLISISKYSADELRQNLKSHFGSKFFIFDGINNFQNASNLIWKSEIADLSPYLTVLNLNTFLKKFQSLYTKVFGVVEKLNLVVLIDLLEKMKDDPKDSILIFSVYNLIEHKFQKELIESKDLNSKFLLPVLNLNNNFEFEKIENCVYLVETDFQDTFNSNEIVYDEILSQKIDLLSQKGFKICCQKISTKFLRKLGVSSSIEKLMDVENMSMESFGQYEKITDRIKELLDGYKDGISIFKEAIQNADDAGATIVKICYDKRKNSLWKNPNKLLDRGLVKCQGESLIFYNDAVFTDSDFKNLIRLGAGTKKNLKEKVGKFGLGFNTFYNVTDLPCILSRDSLVLLDPNVKFMTNIIRNRGEPGKKINFKSVNQFMRTNYCDQFKPFENLFGCDIFSNDFFYNGTLIRLPLRTEPSEISSHIYNKDSEIKSLLTILINNAESLLLFTQSVCTVEFHVIPSEATGPDSKLLLKFEKKPELYLEKFPNPSFSKEPESEFPSQTKILSACSKNSECDLKSAIILCSTVEFFDENFSHLCPKFKSGKRSGEHHWLTVSSYFSKYLIKNNPVFETFVPCVGCAVKLEKIENNYSIVDTSGQIFCFLPLPIYSNLKFHVNAAFNISRDRLNFNESTKDDKVSDEKHKWNSYLVQPLVENLLLMINHSLNAVKLDNIANFLSIMWPLEMKNSFFKDFEKNFYDTICLPNNGYRIFPTVLDQKNKFTCFDQSLFVDFDFENEKIQSSALGCLKKIYHSKSLVVLPSKYLVIIKNKTTDASKFVNDFTLLKILVSNLSSLDLDDYIQLLKFYLLQKCFNLSNMTMYANLIKEKKCIPTCNGTFKFVNDLVDPNSNQYFKSLFSEEDDMFPCNELIENNQVSNKLANLGMKKHFLDHETVIKLAEKIESCNDLTKARNLSEILSEYLYDYFLKLLNTNLNDLKEKLDNVKWLFPVTKPESWPFPWFESNNRKYKPSELYNSREKQLIGSIAPLYKEKYSNFMKNLNKNDMLNLVMEQFIFLKKHYESTDQPLSQFTDYFTEFCKYLQNNSTEKNSINQQQKVDSQIQIFKESLPQKWIFCENNSQKNKFVSLDSFAVQVQNPSEPDLLQFPKNLIDDHKKTNFFKQMGLIDFFSLESLRSRIESLKNKFQDSPLGDSELNHCLKIVNEILYIDKNRKDSQYLDQMILDKQFYLPDENCVLRRIEEMCYEKSLSSLLAEHKIYPVHLEIPFKSFSIKSSRDKVLKTIGNQLCIDTELFGQKESLIDRIRDILSRYSSESTIFKELIQNADDAKATTVSFILDTRNLGTSCLPYEEMKNLQGPSICCYNNSIFSEQDLKGIISLSKGSKQKSMEKIGKFGIGFNSVYHLTDVPQFISNFSDFVLLDPSCKYYTSLNETNPGIKIKNAKMNLKNDLFRDVLSGFELNECYHVQISAKKNSL